MGLSAAVGTECGERRAVKLAAREVLVVVPLRALVPRRVRVELRGPRTQHRRAACSGRWHMAPALVHGTGAGTWQRVLAQIADRSVQLNYYISRK